MREPATLRYQLSIQVPLLALGCLNPWLYHKLSLTCCHGETIASRKPYKNRQIPKESPQHFKLTSATV